MSLAITPMIGGVVGGRDINRGILVSVMFGPVAITGHVFNPDLDRPTWVLAVELGL